MPLAERNSHDKLAVPAYVDLAGERNVALERGTELTVHMEVIHQILPAVAAAHIATTGAAKTATRSHHQGDAVFIRKQHAFAGQVEHRAGIARSADIQMRRQEGIRLHPREEAPVPFA